MQDSRSRAKMITKQAVYLSNLSWPDSHKPVAMGFLIIGRVILGFRVQLFQGPDIQRLHLGPYTYYIAGNHWLPIGKLHIYIYIYYNTLGLVISYPRSVFPAQVQSMPDGTQDLIEKCDAFDKLSKDFWSKVNGKKKS